MRIPDGAGGYIEDPDRELTPQEAKAIAEAMRDTLAPALTAMVAQFQAMLQAITPAVLALVANYQGLIDELRAALPEEPE